MLKRYFFLCGFIHTTPTREMKRTNGGVPMGTAAWAAEWCLEYHRIMTCCDHTTDARQIAVLDQNVVDMIQDKITRFSDTIRLYSRVTSFKEQTRVLQCDAVSCSGLQSCSVMQCTAV